MRCPGGLAGNEKASEATRGNFLYDLLSEKLGLRSDPVQFVAVSKRTAEGKL